MGEKYDQLSRSDKSVIDRHLHRLMLERGDFDVATVRDQFANPEALEVLKKNQELLVDRYGKGDFGLG